MIDQHETERSAALDRARFHEVTNGNADMVQILAQTYSTDLRERLVVVEAALEAGDLEEVIEMTHAIRGASANLGTGPVGEAASAIEQAGHDGDLQACRAGLPELVRRSEILLEVFAEMLEQTRD